MANDFELIDIPEDPGEGDLVWQSSEEQAAAQVIVASPGHCKQYPLVGVGIVDYLGAPFTSLNRGILERRIRLQLEADGSKNLSVKVNPDATIEINRNE